MAESPPDDTLIDALLRRNAINPKSLVDGKIPTTGTIEFMVPMDGHESAMPYSVDARDLWALSDQLAREGMHEYKFVGSGQHAIVFSAHNSHYEENKKDPVNARRAERPILRIHFGEPHYGRQSPDVIPSLKTISVNKQITCEEVEYVTIPPKEALDPKIVLGLGVSCLANGWLLHDPDTDNIVMRLGDTRMGVLEPQAVDRISDNPDSVSFLTRRFKDYSGEQRRSHDHYRKRIASRARENERSTDDSEFSQGDVIETQSNIVVLLNGDYYETSYRDTIPTHPQLEERRELVKSLLKDEGIASYKEMGQDFIVIPQPNPFPPDPEKLSQSMRLADKLRCALNEHEQARLRPAGEEPDAPGRPFRHRLSSNTPKGGVTSPI